MAWFKKKKQPQTADKFAADFENGVSVGSLREKADVMSLGQEIRRTDLDLRDKEDFLKLRLAWGKALRWILAGMLIYNAVVVVLIGKGVLTFQSDTVTGIVVGQNFVEVIG